MAAVLYTFESAREILLGRSSPAVKALDRLLGVAFLAAGPLGLAAWGWIDQKNELVARLEEMVSRGRRDLAAARGRSRQELLAATHTTIVVASFFAALRDLAGAAYDEINLSEDDERRLADPSTFDVLFRVPVELPWAVRGFDRNTEEVVRPYLRRLAGRTLGLFEGLPAWTDRFGSGPHVADELTRRAVERYRAEYVRLAADVTEFRLWTLLGEERVTHDGLARLESLIAGLAEASRSNTARDAIHALHRAVLLEPMTDLGDLTAVRSPTVERGYVEPAFRWAVMGRGSQPSLEEWWADRPLETDLSRFLAAHLASPESTRQPLVVLGHPGAGKSLFTRVTAARLAASDAFTAVRVPLRDVPDPSATVYQQIDGYLARAAHGRTPWAELVAASAERTRVVFIDGLDELMQATGATESHYLRDVVEFQRTESTISGPVAVIVTSRTVVADLATIPPDCLVIKLEEFGDDLVAAWVDRWNAANAGSGVRRLDATALLEYGDLARQPLLLTLLAIVASERDLPRDGTSAGLYRMLLDDFVTRELTRPDAEGLDQGDRRAAELWKLGLVAFGMHNRGAKHLHEEDLAEDLRALPGPAGPPPRARARGVGRPLTASRRVIGRFFFVNTSEVEGGRSYEFLHATFGDYLIAHHTLEQLREAHASLRSRTAAQPWDDDLLFALLSHKLLVTTGTRTVTFFGELADGDRALPDVLHHLISHAFARWGPGRFAGYDPAGLTPVHRLAAYTANLVLLSLAVAGEEGVAIAALCPEDTDADAWWWTQVRLWQAALPATDVSTVARSIGVDASRRHIGWASDRHAMDLSVDWLAGDVDGSFGRAVGSGFLPDDFVFVEPTTGRLKATTFAGTLAHRIGNGSRIRPYIPRRPADGTMRVHVASLLMTWLERAAPELDYDQVRELCEWALDAIGSSTLRTRILASLVTRHPALLLDVPTIDVALAGDLHVEARVMLQLASLVRDDGPHFFDTVPTDVADSPEARAVVSLPPDLARRAIPELVGSLVGRLNLPSRLPSAHTDPP